MNQPEDAERDPLGPLGSDVTPALTQQTSHCEKTPPVQLEIERKEKKGSRPVHGADDARALLSARPGRSGGGGAVTLTVSAGYFWAG